MASTARATAITSSNSEGGIGDVGDDYDGNNSSSSDGVENGGIGSNSNDDSH